MCEWLKIEIAKVHTPKFHVVDGPASAELRNAIAEADLPMPPSYLNFVLQCGNANLYRKGSGYLVRVFAAPREIKTDTNRYLLQFGRTDLSLVYFDQTLLVRDKESPVIEWRHNVGLRRLSIGFEEWLRRRCASSRKRYSKKEWKDIVKGPVPFSEHEKAIVEARRKIRWRVVGIAENGDLEFEIHNESAMTLPFLSLAISGKNGEVEGGIWLPISHIAPGESCIVQKGCYKDRVLPQNVVVSDEPDPGPEDRDLYWEFKN